MTRPLTLLIVSALVLSACAQARESRFNPRNWFGASQSEPSLGPISNTTDNRALVTEITALSIERTSSGALLRAEGRVPAAGYWDVELVADNNGRPRDGVLTYSFVAAAPRSPVPTPNDAARRLVVATPIPSAILDQTGSVVVRAASNSRTVRR